MNDEDVRRLFRSVESRATPPSEVRDRVRDAVHDAWTDLPSARRAGRSVAVYGVAAGVFAAAVATWLVWMPERAGPSAVAGELAYATGGHVVVANGELDAPLLALGATVETNGSGRALIRLKDGALLRLDAGTRLTLQAATEMGLAKGRLFAHSTDSGIGVATASGVRVEPAGTQFEVAVDEDRVEVVVREGAVDLHVAGRTIRSEAREGMGEALTLEGPIVMSRKPMSTTEARWDWIHGSMPAFELDGATVFDFLTWAAAETGLGLDFADRQVSRHAKGVRLHGPPIPPERIDRAEIGATLETVPSLQIRQSEGHRLVVDWSSAASAGRSDFSTADELNR